MNKTLAFAAGFALLTSPAFAQESSRAAIAGSQVGASYNPAIDPADFTHVITNKYYSPKPGMKAAYEKRTSEGIGRVELEVTGKTKKVMGVTTLVIRVREWLNDKMVEETRDWVAQDKDGNVWYFGEAIDNYERGKLVNHDGSWEAGVDGAKPGILMLNNPKAGDTYRREYYPGKAEDMATVIAVGRKLKLPHGAFFENCVQIRDWSRLKKESDYKYHCVGIGLMVLERQGAERLKLVSFSNQNAPKLRWTRRTLASQGELQSYPLR
jgi:hypothetical protein